MIDLLKQVSQCNILVAYVLFDSWFTYAKALLGILELRFHTIAMVKAMPRVYYNNNGKLLNLNVFYANLRKRRGKVKILSSAIVGIGSDKDGNKVKSKIVFVRNRNRSRQWLALISTDISLSREEIIRIYG